MRKELCGRVRRSPADLALCTASSYGTILGAYLVNMIPDKIGRVIVDGVASAPRWANQHPHDWLHSWIVDTEKTFQWFLRDCSEVSNAHL